MFKGFVHRAKKICSPQYIEEELEFLINVFVENDYDENILRNIVQNYNVQQNVQQTRKNTETKYVSLPFIPHKKHQLKKVFGKAGFTVAFKSGRNLQSALTNRNMPKLPENSYPGVYKIPCDCSGNYIGQTGKKSNNPCESTRKINIRRKMG